MFEQNLDANLERLMKELKTGACQPLPARRVYIPKDAKGTKFRPLGISSLQRKPRKKTTGLTKFIRQACFVLT